MKECKKCKGKDIKSRVNYSHGKKSKGITSLSCKKCGSTDIEVKSADPRRRGNRNGRL